MLQAALPTTKRISWNFGSQVSGSVAQAIATIVQASGFRRENFTLQVYVQISQANVHIKFWW